MFEGDAGEGGGVGVGGSCVVTTLTTRDGAYLTDAGGLLTPRVWKVSTSGEPTRSPLNVRPELVEAEGERMIVLFDEGDGSARARSAWRRCRLIV